MIRNQVVDPLFPQCPVRNVLSRIGDSWSLLVLLALHDKAEAMRFSDLCRAIPDVSQKMLTSTLRKLEADDLLSRTIYPEVPPRVEYKLTKRGKTLIPLLNQLVDWSLDNMDAIIRHREKYEL
ncbi:MAG: winged helix-turn-helix transcriptional regulator [Prevotella sp.]|nr:helix-turn-helix transcriptional regulator [Prevotella sp.]